MENDLLKSKMDETSYQKIKPIKNKKLAEFLHTYVEHCEPESIFVSDGSAADAAGVYGADCELTRRSDLARVYVAIADYER